MEAYEVLESLEDAGIRVRADIERGKLFAGPTSLLTDEIEATIREHRSGILAILEAEGVIQSEAEVFDLAREWVRREMSER